MSSNVQPWQYADVPARRLWTQAGLALVGLGVSLYLTWIKLSGGSAYCAGVGDCDLVQNSVYSELLGIPIALFGAGLYAIVLSLAIVRHRVDRRTAEYALLGQLALVLAGVLYSAYLTYVELYVIDAICPWCVVSAVIVTVLLILTAYDVSQNAARL